MSEVLRADLIKHIGIHPDKIGVLYNGVDLEKFRARDPTAIRHSLKAGTRIVVGSVGRLVSVKNYALLIEAVYLLRDRFALLLVFVGDGPQRKALEALAFQRCLTASVVFLGHRDDVHALIGGMDIFVLPSLNEGMSNTLIEALATGVPCIASRVGGNPEVIGDQQAGLLFESDNASDLADKIASLCANQGLRYELGQRGQVRAQDAFSLSAMIKNYEGMYKRVLNPSDGAHNATLSG